MKKKGDVVSNDSTFKVIKPEKQRSQLFEDYRQEWDRRAADLDPGMAPVHLDLELSAHCDLRCGASDGKESFCNIWTHEHIRKKGWDVKTHPTPGFMGYLDAVTVLDHAAAIGVQSVKFNYRGEPSMHPDLDSIIYEADALGFKDIMINTNGNGRARKEPDLFFDIVEAGITSLNFSVDACDEETYLKQRYGGDWEVLLNSVKTAVKARDEGYGVPDLQIRASAVRTSLNKNSIDSGDLVEFWTGMGVDWVSVSECYFPGGTKHPWAASHWAAKSPTQFQCADPFRRMIVTWDLEHTFPCCQGFPGSIDGGGIKLSNDYDLLKAYHSPAFSKLRNHHVDRTWNAVHLCRTCPLTHEPT